MGDKISIRFYGDRPVRAIWDEDDSKWWFSVLDVIANFNDRDDYAKTRNLTVNHNGEGNSVHDLFNPTQQIDSDFDKQIKGMLDM